MDQQRTLQQVTFNVVLSTILWISLLYPEHLGKLFNPTFHDLFCFTGAGRPAAPGLLEAAKGLIVTRRVMRIKVDGYPLVN